MVLRAMDAVKQEIFLSGISCFSQYSFACPLISAAVRVGHYLLRLERVPVYFCKIPVILPKVQVAGYR